MKTFGINGKRYRDLSPCEIRMSPIPTLEQPAEIKWCNASMPKAPAGYAWPHLKTPARLDK